ncbi:MAG: hypothetical protein AAGB93_05265 [Planctomycetota bacterium]
MDAVPSSRGAGGRTRATIACAGLVVASLLAGCASTPDAPQVFAERVAAEHSVDSLGLLREAADHEALYTLVGGLKPMSSGVWSGSFEIDHPDLSEVRSVRAALAPLRSDSWYADVQVFAEAHEGERSAQAFVVHRGALARMIERFEPFWSPWGITPDTHPAEVVAVVDRMPRADRWRGYGYLFGFPVDSVDFFVDAGIAAEDGAEIGPGKDREFVQIPTHAAETGRFVYAVPVGHVRTVADEALADEARRILAAYRESRGRTEDVATGIEELRRLDRRFAASAARAAGIRDAPSAR